VGAAAYALSLTAVVVTGVLACKLLDWLGIGAPMFAKILFTSSMQVIGALAMGSCVLLIPVIFWRELRR